MILVTGFEPYNGSHVNPSSLVLAHLPDVVQGRMLRKVVLPCDSQQTPPHAKELASDPAIGSTLILGEDRRYALPTLERTAYNWLEYEVPDNSGHQPRQARIVEQGPSSIPTSLDLEVLRQSLASQGVVIDVACDPGRHLCNHVYYTLLYHALRQALPRTILLFHLPRLPEQHTYPNLSFDESFRATLALLEQLSFMEDNNGSN